MADQEINLRKQRFRIGLNGAAVQRLLAESEELISGRTGLRRQRMASAAAFTAVSGLPAKFLRR